MKRITTYGSNEQLRLMLEDALHRDGATAKGRSHWLCKAAHPYSQTIPVSLLLAWGEGVATIPAARHLHARRRNVSPHRRRFPSSSL